MKPFKLDYEFLEEVGLKDLPENERPAMLKYIQEVLEVRVGRSLSKGLPDELLEEFYSYARQNQSEEALAWIRKNAPNYSEVVRLEMIKLKQEIKSSAKQILENPGSFS